VILGCTEITLLIDAACSPLPVFDSTVLHAAAAVDWMLRPTTRRLDDMPWTLARRAARLEPVDHPRDPEGHRAPRHHLAGRRPAVGRRLSGRAMREACARVLRDNPREALQYAASEGFGPLREWVAAELGTARACACDASQVLITTGSQQGLDLVGKVLIDPGSRVAVESPTYLGALQAFAPTSPTSWPSTATTKARSRRALDAARGARFLYLLPNFQNPSGRCLSARAAPGAGRAARPGLPVVEDNPYGDLWFDAPPPPPLRRAGRRAVYLGSFSKVLAPGLRLGYVVAPEGAVPQAAAGQAGGRPAHAGLQPARGARGHQGRLPAQHVPTIRARYKAQRDAMRRRCRPTCPAAAAGRVPVGGMFFWVELPAGLDATALLPQAVDAGVAYVPGAPFFADGAHANTLRLSFVTVPADRAGHRAGRGRAGAASRQLA
jgi:2-aminoadipate transaminase